jgi:hypothetical protein
MKPDNPDVFAWILEEYERSPKTRQAKLNVEAEAYLIAVAGRYVLGIICRHFRCLETY